jgi:hypothetical protein
MGRRAALVRDPCEQSSAQLAFLIPNAKSSTRLLVDVEYPQALFFLQLLPFTIFYYHRYTDSRFRRVALKFDLLFL